MTEEISQKDKENQQNKLQKHSQFMKNYYCKQEERILQMESKIKYLNRQFNHIEKNIQEIKKDIKDLSNGGFAEMLQDQNKELTNTLTKALENRQEYDKEQAELKKEAELMDKKIKLKIWHVIALFLGSGILTAIIQKFLL